MTIKLTTHELLDLARTGLGLPAGIVFDIEISDDSVSEILAALRRALAEYPAHASHEKIPAIKAFRNYCPKNSDGNLLGLCEAKWAIENSQLALKNIEKFGRLQ